MTKELNLSKLPKWAQDHIQRLEQNLKGTKAALQAFLENEPTGAWLGHEMVQRTYFDPKEIITFVMDRHQPRHPERRPVKVTVQLRTWKPGAPLALDIRTEDSACLIIPEGANGVMVAPTDW